MRNFSNVPLSLLEESLGALGLVTVNLCEKKVKQKKRTSPGPNESTARTRQRRTRLLVAGGAPRPGPYGPAFLASGSARRGPRDGGEGAPPRGPEIARGEGTRRHTGTHSHRYTGCLGLSATSLTINAARVVRAGRSGS